MKGRKRGVWEQKQPPGNVPLLPSLSKFKTVWKHSLIRGRGRGGGISKYQPFRWSWGFITVCEPKQISLKPTSSDWPHSEPPFLSTWFLQSSALTQPARQSDTSSGNSTPPPPPQSPRPQPVCLFVCALCFDSRPVTVHTHAQHCSSINKRLPLPLSTPP